MSVTLFWRCESATFSGTDDYSAGDNTPTATGSPTFSSTQAKVGTNSLLIDGDFESYHFDSAGIAVAAEGSAGFWFYPNGMANNAILFQIYDASSVGDHISVYYTATDEIGVEASRVGQGVTEVNTTAANLSTGAWYFCVIRWHTANQDLRIEVYNSTPTLIQGVENLAIDSTHFPLDSAIDRIGIGDGVGANANSYIDNIMVSNTYAEPLQNYALYLSPQQIGRIRRRRHIGFHYG